MSFFTGVMNGNKGSYGYRGEEVEMDGGFFWRKMCKTLRPHQKVNMQCHNWIFHPPINQFNRPL